MLILTNLEYMPSADVCLQLGGVLLTVFPPKAEFVDSVLRVCPHENQERGHNKRDRYRNRVKPPP